MDATLRADLYERVVDRLRHAQQYADAAQLMASEALGVFQSTDEEVLAMTANVAPALGEHLVDLLRQAQQYAEAARGMTDDALRLLETLERGERS